MNRAERRAARADDRAKVVIHVDFCRLMASSPQSPVECYVCGAMHAASAFAMIERNGRSTNAMLCEPCFANRQDDVTRKFLNLSGDVPFVEGGEITTEQALALDDSQNATEH